MGPQIARRRSLASLVRAPIWWTPKVLPVVAAASLGSLTAGVSAGDGLPRVAAMVVSAIGVAAFAHVVNDLTDQVADRLAGKRNALSDASTWMPWALLVGCSFVAVTPWIFVSIGTSAAVTLAVLVLTSIAYSVPPLRLKNRGLWGVVADAAVAHVLPTLFAFLLMGSAGTRTTAWWAATIAACIWALGFGIRSIVVHQILDMDSDTRAAVETLVVKRGKFRSARTARDAFALELAGLVVLAGVTAWVAWGAALFFAMHLGLWAYHRRWDRSPIDTVPTTHDQWMPLTEFYEVWPAVALSLALAAGDLAWAWLAGVMVVLFWPAIRKQLLDQLTLLAEFLLQSVWRRTERVAIWLWWGLVRAGRAIVVAVRELGYTLARTWWALYRAHWRVRHWFGPLVRLFRRQKRRAKRILGRGGAPGKLPG